MRDEAAVAGSVAASHKSALPNRCCTMTLKPKIYLIGASCSGVSTLGLDLSKTLGLPLVDVDAFYWVPTDPPFSLKRPPEERVSLIQSQLGHGDGWILAGSLVGWGDVLIQNADLIVFLHVPTRVRLQRLDAREKLRHGDRISPGGDMHDAHLSFRDWASRYDDPSFKGRSLAQHERWLNPRSAPVLRLDGQASTTSLTRSVVAALA